jgi:hypothetical protein
VVSGEHWPVLRPRATCASCPMSSAGIRPAGGRLGGQLTARVRRIGPLPSAASPVAPRPAAVVAPEVFQDLPHVPKRKHDEVEEAPHRCLMPAWSGRPQVAGPPVDAAVARAGTAAVSAEAPGTICTDRKSASSSSVRIGISGVLRRRGRRWRLRWRRWWCCRGRSRSRGRSRGRWYWSEVVWCRCCGDGCGAGAGTRRAAAAPV